ncbi:hypothetical protein TGME49_227860 [Toxoplasma gondii ME49]|uniref:Small ribosomal subunit protein mS23 n=2 Tax=Toxoplasma gondii TaxID=5811 RepID=A0A086M9R9_TOXGO|nr:hypothetical protein TGME49_227860 [Toxoplasma gondii ME49]EPT27255.1 hypothetical protein TGME49_227860 [Toxoplasma gondii ME49]KFG65637.1 hypothetical protein TGRUB_227860 [Toxoplasma gondii RUB]|eukprot:XP_002366409.1 hypothetical protein TGME49_227860 [Toxoplasma gondii ME49]
MGKGAVHYTGTNFRRVQRLDIVDRMRALVAQGLVDAPLWLSAAERAPPMELSNLKLMDRKVHNKYLSLTQAVLKKYPNMRFQDCYVDGNDWSKGNDSYRADHPVMQFVALQLRLMNLGLDRHAAFREAEQAFYARRMQLEKQQKLNMAAAVVAAAARDPSAFARRPGSRGQGGSVPSSSLPRLTAMGLGDVQPLFTSGQAYWQFEIAKSQANHLLRIRSVLRRMKAQAEAAAQQEAESPSSSPPPSPSSPSAAASPSPRPSRRGANGLQSLRQRAFSLSERQRRASLLGQRSQAEEASPLSSLAARSSVSSTASGGDQRDSEGSAERGRELSERASLSGEEEELEEGEYLAEPIDEEAMMRWFDAGEEEFDGDEDRD